MAALVGQQAAANRGVMIEPLHGKEIDYAAMDAGLWVSGPIHHPGNAGMDDGTGAHGAGLQCDKKLTARQAIVAQIAGGIPQGGDFGMGGRVALADGGIKPPANDFSVAHDNSPHRHFPQAAGGHGLGQGFAHEKFVGHGALRETVEKAPVYSSNGPLNPSCAYNRAIVKASETSMQQNMPEIRPGQSIELLKELHILTRDGKMNQDSRRKLKQVYHLYQFIEPLLTELQQEQPDFSLVDHGAGKSYLGFILYDLFFKALTGQAHIYGIETRDELVQKSRGLAQRLGFSGMSFLNLAVADSITSPLLPEQVDMVTALHACNTATDDAIHFALKKKARFIVLVPCCQAEVAAVLNKNKGKSLGQTVLTEIWRHPIHTREFGSQLTNVLRCLQLEAHGYQVRVTELVGWEHSMKNELIIASYKNLPRRKPAERLNELLHSLGLDEMQSRFFTPSPAGSSNV